MSLKKIRYFFCLFLLFSALALPLHGMEQSNESVFTKLWKLVFATKISPEVKKAPPVSTAQAPKQVAPTKLGRWLHNQVTLKATDGHINVPVDLANKSVMMQNMFKDTGVLYYQQEIPINFSVEILQACMNLLKAYLTTQDTDSLKHTIESHHYSLDQILNIASCADYLDIPIQKTINNHLITLFNSTSLQDILNKKVILSNLSEGVKQTVIKILQRKLKNLFISRENIEPINLPEVEGGYGVICFRPHTKTFIYASAYGASLFAKTIQDNGTIIDEPITFDKKHNGIITDIVFSKDGKKMVTGSIGKDKNLIVWTFNDDGSITSQYLEGHPAVITKIVLSPNGRLLASTVYQNQTNESFIWILGDNSNMQPKTLRYVDMILNPIDFSHDSALLVCSDRKGMLNIIQFDDTIDSEPKGIHSDPEPHFSGTFYPDCRKFITFGKKTLVIYDLGNMDNIKIHNITIPYDDSIHHDKIIIDSMGNLIAECFLGKGEIHLIDINTEKIIKKLTSKTLKALSFSENGEYLIGCDLYFKGSLYSLTNIMLKNATKDLNKLACLQIIILSKLIESEGIALSQEQNEYLKQLESLPVSIKQLLKHMKLISLPISPISQQPIISQTAEKATVKKEKAKVAQKKQDAWLAAQLQKKKEDMRKYFSGPHLKTPQARTQTIMTLKDIYQGVDKTAFEEVVKEMGLSHLLQ